MVGDISTPLADGQVDQAPLGTHGTTSSVKAQPLLDGYTRLYLELLWLKMEAKPLRRDKRNPQANMWEGDRK